ncbi:uncharacterized protein [Littorina saxatilis]|uniref:uncharacterized protein n=1 Tax=Littorina saxatilis TaxID=31220 RepID=UPI0038B62320
MTHAWLILVKFQGDESVQSNASSPVSEGSLSDDFLRIILFTSSSSSLSDDDPARPDVRSSSSVTTTATVHPAPKTGGMAAMTIADSWGEPSLDSEDASHPRVSCADELKTATTVHTGEEEAAVTPAAAWAEPLYENNISIPPCHTLNDDYLQPIVSTLARERPGPPPNMSAGTMSTASDGAPQRESTTQVSAQMPHNSMPDDYLHPIASVLEGAMPATQARSDWPTQGRTASVSTASDVQPQQGNVVVKHLPHNNLPDDNFYPVSSALDKKTTANTVQPKPPGEREAVYEPPYENTMEMSPRLSHSTLPGDYLHPVTSTQDLPTSIIELSSSCLTSRASTRSRSDPPYENTREMSPSLSDNTLTDDYLHPVASTTEAATTTTVTNSPCLITPTNTDSTYEPPYKNIDISPSVSED